jgi:hypothetical protein
VSNGYCIKEKEEHPFYFYMITQCVADEEVVILAESRVDIVEQGETIQLL